VAKIEPRLWPFVQASLAWCPDSTCLLVTDTLGADKADALFQISLDTGERRQLTHPEGTMRDADPAVSPDGSLLVFRRDANPGAGAFYRLSLKDGKDSEGDPVRLTSPTLWPSKPAWIPDSRDILFSARGGLFRLDAMTGGTPSRLPFVDQDGRSPVVSRVPGGRRLVYVRAFDDPNVWRVDTAPGIPATSPPAAAIASTRVDMGPNLTADGRRVVFVSDRSGEIELWVADPDGSNAFPLTSMVIAPGFPRWSPDRTMIAYHDGDPEKRRGDVFIVPARGGQPRNMTKDLEGGGFPSFSRDGQWLYFGGVGTGDSRIFKMLATGGRPVPVTDKPSAMPIESYDGDLFYLDNLNGAGSVWRLPRSGGPAVKVVEGVVSGNFDVVDGGLYYIDSVSGNAGSFGTLGFERQGSDTRLRYFDFATSQSTTVAANLGMIVGATNGPGGLSATRDGRTVLFARRDSEINELMLVDNFR
jgi:Tol biopolymer transport system component